MTRIVETAIFIAIFIALAAPGIALSQDSLTVLAATSPTDLAPAENFTGTARVGGWFQAPPPARTYGATVAFEPGARTHWHVHPLGQTLVVTAGTGRVQQRGGAVQEIGPGDVVQIPPGAKHWHGASEDAAMTHVATVERPDEGPSTVWMEEVADRQYAGRTDAASGVAANGDDQPSWAQQLMGDIAPKLADLTDDILFGQVWSDPTLSPRDRSLVTVSALVAMNRPDQLRSHLLARRNGVTEDELIGAITYLAFYSGWPNSVTAVTLAREVFQNN